MSFRITNDRDLAKLRKKGLTKEVVDNPYELELYQLLVNEFGGLVEGGEVAREVFGMCQRNFRLDVALPRFKIGIELDGYKDHGAFIKGFKRDREKDLLLMAHGWQILRVYPKQIKDPNVINVIKLIMGKNDRCNIEYQQTDSGWIKLL